MSCSLTLLKFTLKKKVNNLVVKNVKVKVKQSRYRPGVAHRVPGS